MKSKLNSLLEDLGGLTPQAAVPVAETARTTGMTGVTSSIEDKAAQLLGSGVNSEAVAAALGVTPSRISQLLAEDHFSRRVADLRYLNLQKHNNRDSAYDSLEDRLLDKLDKAMPLLVRPRDILDAMTRVNNAKRRGQSAATEVNNHQNIVTLVLPSVITNKFAVSVNVNNQVIKAGEQELLTMPSGNLLKRVEDKQALRLEEGNAHELSQD